MRLAVWLAMSLCACDCSSSAPDDAAADASADAGWDASSEGGVDAAEARDANPGDAGVDADPAGDAGGEPPLADEVQALLDAFCANEIMCANRRAPLIEADFCHPRLFGERPTLWTAGLRSGRFRVGDAYHECLTALASTCADLFVLTCTRPFEGLVGEGADCFVPGECAEGLECISSGTCPRTCRPPRAAGELCGAAESCGPEAVCPLSFGSLGSDTECDALAHAGEPCVRLNGCVLGAYCEGGTCIDQVGIGDPCVPSSGAFSPECDTGLVCIPDGDGGSRCTETRDLVEGDPCAYVRGDPCPADLACASSEGEWVCRRGGLAGEPCDATSPCTSGARCVAGTCVSVVAPGAPCGPTAACTSEHYCAPSGVCEPLPTAGLPCSVEVDCTGGARCDGTRCGYPGEPGDDCDFDSQCLGFCGEDFRCGPLRAEGDLCHYGLPECAPPLECREDADGRPRCQPLCRP